MDSEHRGKKAEFKKKVQELAKKKMMEPKHHLDISDKYSSKLHKNKRPMSSMG